MEKLEPFETFASKPLSRITVEICRKALYKRVGKKVRWRKKNFYFYS